MVARVGGSSRSYPLKRGSTTTPNPTSGFLLFLPKEDVLVLDMTVEEGIKMVMSGGIVTPPDPRPAEVQEVPRLSAKTYEELDVRREKKKV